MEDTSASAYQGLDVTTNYEDRADFLCCCCLDMNCRQWIQWRITGHNQKRTPWKTACSVCLLANFSCYFYIIGSSLPLWFMGLFLVMKLLVEIWGQETPSWVCPGGYCMFFVVYFVGVPFVVLQFGYCTRSADMIFAYSDVVAVGLYLFGSVLSLLYELHRFHFKAQPENKGKLHTTFLAAYCIHPNYFGDLFTYGGWGLAGGTTCGVALPLTMLFAFAVFVVPNSDKYLAERYPDEFPAYAEKTATLIPFFNTRKGLLIVGWACGIVGAYLQSMTCSAACGM